LTNSCSSPCLQKTQIRTMRVLQDEDECRPLMDGGGGGGGEEMA
jgi:hypothetical protein